MKLVSLLCLLVTSLHSQTVTMAFVGDINFTGRIGEQMAVSGTSWPFEAVKSQLKSADYTVGNLESPAGIGGAKYCEKRVYFKANPKNLDALTDAGFDLVSLANNHALDYGPDIIKQTQDELDKRGIKHMGILDDYTQKNEPVIVDIKGTRFAFLAYCNACPQEFGPKKDSPGVSVGLGEWIKRQTKSVRTHYKPDYIIAMPHWGSEYFGVDKNQLYTRRMFNEAGVDVVIGAHPHVLQKAEWVNGTLVAHSLGNFLFPMRWQISMSSAILMLSFEKGKKPTYEVVPVNLTSNRPVLVNPESPEYKRTKYILDKGYEYGDNRKWPEDKFWE